MERQTRFIITRFSSDEKGLGQTEAFFYEVAMLLTKDDLICALREARNLREAMDQYCLHPAQSPISMDVVMVGVKNYCNVDVEFRLLPFESENRLRGIYLPYEEKTVILIDADLPSQWQRYVAMKEMGHVVLADAENVTTNPGETIEFMVQDGLGAATGLEVPPDAANEVLAKVLAYEVFFPHSERERAKNMVDKDASLNLFLLSEEYDLPQHVIEYILSENYLGMCEELRPQI